MALKKKIAIAGVGTVGKGLLKILEVIGNGILRHRDHRNCIQKKD